MVLIVRDGAILQRGKRRFVRLIRSIPSEKFCLILQNGRVAGMGVPSREAIEAIYRYDGKADKMIRRGLRQIEERKQWEEFPVLI